MIYLMRYKGSDELTKEHVVKMLQDHDLKILDDSALPKMAKVEGENPDIDQLKAHWDFFPEKKYGVPDTRKKIKK